MQALSMEAESITKTIKQWDGLLVAVVSVLFLFSTFLAHYWFDSIRDDIRVLQAAKEQNAVDIATLRATSDMHYNDIIRRMDEMRSWANSMQNKLDMSLSRTSDPKNH